MNQDIYFNQLLGGGKEQVKEVNIEHLTPYPNQPFKPYTQDKLEELAEDIKQNGIYSPILVRQLEQSYQILAGHNRVNAARLAGLKTVPVIIKNVTDDEAQLIMLNTNLNQRDELLPSEKAKAYKMQMDAIKRQGRRTDLTSYPMDTKLDTQETSYPMDTRLDTQETSYPMDTKLDTQETSYPMDTKIDSGSNIAKTNKDSRVNVFRYIRLNYLIPEFLDMVDIKAIPFRAGVELSYLDEQAQRTLEQYMQSKRIHTVTLEQATEIRSFTDITDGKLDKIFGKVSKEKSAKPKTISFRIPTEYFTESLPDLEIDDKFMRWLADKIGDYAKGIR